MSQRGDERQDCARRGARGRRVMTFGAADAGEVLAERYRLEEHIDTDAARPPVLARRRRRSPASGRRVLR